MKHSVFVLGGNEIASATALSLFRGGFQVILIADRSEFYLRHNLCFGEAVDQGQKVIEGVTAELLQPEKLLEKPEKTFPEQLNSALSFLLKDRKIPVINEIPLDQLITIKPPVAVINSFSRKPDFEFPDSIPLVGLYPDQRPGKDCYLAVERRLIHQLGKIYQPGDVVPAESNFDSHFFKNPLITCPTPLEGIWVTGKSIGDTIQFNEALGKINDIEIRSPYEGQIWGLAHSGKLLPAKHPVALIYQGPPSEHFREFTFRHRAIARGFLEAILRILKT